MSIVSAPPLDAIPLYNHDVQESSGFPGPVGDLAAAIRAADGVLICSPEYNWSIPGVLKNAIDWVSRMKDQPFAASRWRCSRPRPASSAAHACSTTCGSR